MPEIYFFKENIHETQMKIYFLKEIFLTPIAIKLGPPNHVLLNRVPGDQGFGHKLYIIGAQ